MKGTVNNFCYFDFPFSNVQAILITPKAVPNTAFIKLEKSVWTRIMISEQSGGLSIYALTTFSTLILMPQPISIFIPFSQAQQNTQATDNNTPDPLIQLHLRAINIRWSGIYLQWRWGRLPSSQWHCQLLPCQMLHHLQLIILLVRQHPYRRPPILGDCSCQ